jgi:segregation and condensation protein A
MAYRIQLPQFEGPLELLLVLIEKQKLDVTRVSLAQVTDQYLEHISSEENISLENLAWFLAIAARLILIKSKALLPILQFDDEEEEEIEDLEYQLREYKKFKEASLKMKGLFDLKRRSFAREGYVGVQSIFYPPQNVTGEILRKHLLNVLGDIPVFEKLEEKVVREVVTLEEKIVSLQEMLRRKVQTSFREVVSSAKDRVDVIVSFLAMLELVKQRIIHAEQEDLFSEIRLKHKEAAA